MGISNTQYRDIIFQYDQRRMKNQRLLNKRYDMLYQKYPELKEIHDKIIELSMEQAANEVLTPGQAAEKRASYLQAKDALLARKAAILKENH